MRASNRSGLINSSSPLRLMIVLGTYPVGDDASTDQLLDEMFPFPSQDASVLSTLLSQSRRWTLYVKPSARITFCGNWPLLLFSQ